MGRVDQRVLVAFLIASLTAHLACLLCSLDRSIDLAGDGEVAFLLRRRRRRRRGVAGPAPGLLRVPGRPAPPGLHRGRVAPRHRPLRPPRRRPPRSPRRRQGARLLPGGEPRRAAGGDAGDGGGVRGVLPAAGGGQGGVLLGRGGESQPPLLQHHLRGRRPALLARLPPPRLRLPHRRRRQDPLARQAPPSPRCRGEVLRGDEGIGDRAAAAAVRGDGAQAGLLRGRPHRRRCHHQRQPLPSMPGSEPDAGLAAALRPQPHHPAPPGRRLRPPGLLQWRLDQRRPRPRRLRRQFWPPPRDCDERGAEEHRAQGDDELGGSEDVGGDVHDAADGLPRRPGEGACRRRRPAAVSHRHVPRVHAHLQDRRRAPRERREGLQDLIRAQNL